MLYRASTLKTKSRFCSPRKSRSQHFKTISLTKENNDLLQQFVLPANNSDRVELRFHDSGSLAHQTDGRYFVPWGNREGKDALSIDLA